MKTREPRAGAGNKMSSLLETAMEDDFYKDAYGGAFQEVISVFCCCPYFDVFASQDDQDDLYQSPAHSDEDIVDSDFDKPEV